MRMLFQILKKRLMSYKEANTFQRVLAFRGKHKIKDTFQEETYTVIEQPNDNIPVFCVKSDTSCMLKTLHRNHLFPIGHERKEKKNVPLPRKKLSLLKKSQSDVVTKRSIHTYSSDESDEDMESGKSVGIIDVIGDARTPEKEIRRKDVEVHENDKERRDEEVFNGERRYDGSNSRIEDAEEDVKKREF